MPTRKPKSKDTEPPIQLLITSKCASINGGEIRYSIGISGTGSHVSLGLPKNVLPINCKYTEKYVSPLGGEFPILSNEIDIARRTPPGFWTSQFSAVASNS